MSITVKEVVDLYLKNPAYARGRRRLLRRRGA